MDTTKDNNKTNMTDVGLVEGIKKSSRMILYYEGEVPTNFVVLQFLFSIFFICKRSLDQLHQRKGPFFLITW